MLLSFRAMVVPGLALLLLVPFIARGEELRKDEYFKITVIDEATERGVPLVECATTNDIRYYTDSNGIIAFYEPGLMDQQVFFHIKSHGYEFPAGSFDFRGKKLKTTRGGSAVLKITRINLAERLYRVTGGGIYRDSLMVGAPAPLQSPLLNGQVLGQDTVMVVPYRDKLYWFWGDTNRPTFPLGHFATSGATSLLPGKGGLDPSVGVDLTYFVDPSGFSKKMCPMPEKGMIWIGGLMTVPGDGGNAQLIAQYSRMKSLGETAERGLVRFNDAKEVFERIVQFDPEKPLCPRGQPFPVTANGAKYYYFALPHPQSCPNVRVRADLNDLLDPTTYEVFTCLQIGARYDSEKPALDRGSDGRLNYAWKKNTEAPGHSQQQELIDNGHITPEEGWLQFRDIETNAAIKMHAGSVCWNAYRQRWVMISGEVNGTSNLGEIWYTEADTPVGPWVYSRKIVTHDKMSLYNPKQHPYFDQERGRLIYFEGTYTHSFSFNPDQTPRYEYNQMMYRLALDDPRLFLPSPVYQVRQGDGAIRYLFAKDVEAEQGWQRVEGIPFYAYAPDRKRAGLIPVLASKDRAPLFYALPGDASAEETENPSIVPLYEYRSEKDASPRYSTDQRLAETGYQRGAEPICRLWKNPSSALMLNPEARPTPIP